MSTNKNRGIVRISVAMIVTVLSQAFDKLSNVLAETKARALAAGMTVESFASAWNKAMDAVAAHATATDTDPSIIPINFIGREKDEDVDRLVDVFRSLGLSETLFIREMLTAFIVASLRARIQWAEDAEDKPLWPSGPTPKEYVAGFVRKTGSYVEGLKSLDDLFEMIAAIDVIEVTDELDSTLVEPGHQYFEGVIPWDYTAMENIVLASDLTDEELSLLRVVRGPHGMELDGSLLPEGRLDPHPTDKVCFITDKDGLVTWYPGRFSAKSMKEMLAVKGR